MKWLVVFLGNPGDQYAQSRHNAGFIISEYVLDKDSVEQWKYDSYADAQVLKIDQTIFICPQTYMNNSGLSVKYVSDKEQVLPENIIVVYDDVDIPLGSFKISFGKGDGNHNGVGSISSHLKTKEFIRIRIGVGDVKRLSPLRNFVLGKFKKDDLTLIHTIAPTIIEMIKGIITNGLVWSQNNYNKGATKEKEQNKNIEESENSTTKNSS